MGDIEVTGLRPGVVYGGQRTGGRQRVRRTVCATTRAECLDWVLIRGERHLDRVLREFVEHYNNERPHRGIDLEVPVAYSAPRRFTSVDGVQRADRLGGLVHEYCIAA